MSRCLLQDRNESLTESCLQTTCRSCQCYPASCDKSPTESCLWHTRLSKVRWFNDTLPTKSWPWRQYTKVVSAALRCLHWTDNIISRMVFRHHTEACRSSDVINNKFLAESCLWRHYTKVNGTAVMPSLNNTSMTRNVSLDNTQKLSAVCNNFNNTLLK